MLNKLLDKSEKEFLDYVDNGECCDQDIIDLYNYIKKEKPTKDLEKMFKAILSSLGEDVNREGLKDTPKRYIKFLTEFVKPKEIDFNLTTFSSEGYSQMIIEKNISFFSLCEHHLAPFFGEAIIAYIPNKKIVGLSKLPRVLDFFANRLQNQERITNQVTAFLMETLEPEGVGVILKAEHTCMSMRGVKKIGVKTITSCLKGSFLDDLNCRNEFLKLGEL